MIKNTFQNQIKIEPKMHYVKLFWNMLDWSEKNKVDPGDTAAMIRKSFANSDVDWKKAKIYDKNLGKS